MTYKDPVKLAYGKGLACAASRQDEQAICHFSEAIRLQSDHVDAYYQRALMFYRLQRYGEALDDVFEAIRLKPESVPAHSLEAEVKQKLQHLKKAA